MIGSLAGVVTLIITAWTLVTALSVFREFLRD